MSIHDDNPVVATESATEQYERSRRRLEEAHPMGTDGRDCVRWQQEAEAALGFDCSALHTVSHAVASTLMDHLADIDPEDKEAQAAEIFDAVSSMLEIGVGIGQDTGRHIDIDTIGAIGRRTFNSGEDTRALAETYEVSPGNAELIGLAYAMGRTDR